MPEDFQTSAARVESAFYDAFARLDLKLMTAVWLDGERPVCIHPGGPLLRGKASVLRSWAGIFSGAEPPVVEHRLIDRFESDALVVHLVEERIRARSAPVGQFNRVIATNTYVRSDGAWYMLQHHAALPLVKPPDPEDAAPSLH
jgi:hypothetical protein